MGLKDNLPQFVAEEKYTKEILEAIEPEINKVKTKLIETLFETCISTCTDEGIKRFEKDYSIKFDASLTSDERRRQVINKMLAKKRLTKEELANFIKRNIGNGQYYITNIAEKYSFKVRVVDGEHIEQLYKALYTVRPAHLVFSVDLTSYERRCGTFNCNQDVL